jgi:hypothetical protein
LSLCLFHFFSSEPPPPPSIPICLQDLIDPRVERKCDHQLGDILVIGLRTFLRLPHGIPSHDTFNRLFSALDPNAFLNCFLRWTQGVRQAVGEEIVALDGKALRRALKGKSVPDIVSAREIREADAHYVLALKGTQESVHKEVKAFLDDALDHDPKAQKRGIKGKQKNAGSPLQDGSPAQGFLLIALG